MALFKPIKIPKSSLNSLAIQEGQYITCYDTGEIYVDIDYQTRKALGTPLDDRYIEKGFVDTTGYNNNYGFSDKNSLAFKKRWIGNHLEEFTGKHDFRGNPIIKNTYIFSTEFKSRYMFHGENNQMPITQSSILNNDSDYIPSNFPPIDILVNSINVKRMLNINPTAKDDYICISDKEYVFSNITIPAVNFWIEDNIIFYKTSYTQSNPFECIYIVEVEFSFNWREIALINIFPQLHSNSSDPISVYEIIAGNGLVPDGQTYPIFSFDTHYMDLYGNVLYLKSSANFDDYVYAIFPKYDYFQTCGVSDQTISSILFKNHTGNLNSLITKISGRSSTYPNYTSPLNIMSINNFATYNVVWGDRKTIFPMLSGRQGSMYNQKNYRYPLTKDFSLIYHNHSGIAKITDIEEGVNMNTYINGTTDGSMMEWLSTMMYKTRWAGLYNTLYNYQSAYFNKDNSNDLGILRKCWFRVHDVARKP